MAGITLFERASVPDYERWREAFEDFRSKLNAMGVVGSAVYQSADDPADITVMHDFVSLADARAFLESDDLHAARPAAGVSASPTVWFAQRVI